MRITEVSQDYITNGIQADCGRCPVAIALSNNGYYDVTVGNDSISYYNGWLGIDQKKKPNSRKLQVRITRFDNGHKILPFKIIEKDDCFDVYKGE